MKKVNAFTLIELMITITVLGIILALSVPSFYQLIQNNRSVSMVNTLSGAIAYGRGEAIKRGVSVSICPASSVAKTACGTAGQWSTGWIVFLDSDSNGVIANTNDIIRVSPQLKSGTNITSALTVITFNGSGFIAAGAGNLTVSMAGCSGNNGRLLNLNSSGRVSISQTVC